MDQLTFLSGEHPVNRSASPDCEKDWMTTVATWHSNFFALLNEKGPGGLSGRMSPASCQATEEGILVPSSGRWSNAGMGSPTESWTLSMSEFNHIPAQSPNDDGVCSLSDILETGDVQARYCLSAKACAGIIRRAEKKGKTLPCALEAALIAVIERTATTT